MRDNFWFKSREFKVVSPEEIYILEGKRWVEVKFIEMTMFGTTGATRWKARILNDLGKPIWIFKSELLEREEKWRKKLKLGLIRNKIKAKESADKKRLKTRRKNAFEKTTVDQRAMMCLQTCKHDCYSTRNLNVSETNPSKYKGVRIEPITGKFSVIAMGVFIASYDCVLRANKVKLEVDEYILENSSIEVSEVQNAFRYMRKIEKMEQKSEGSEESEE